MLEWLKQITHLEIAMVDYFFAGINGITYLIFKHPISFIIFILLLGVGILNNYISWKTDEFNRRKWKKIN